MTLQWTTACVSSQTGNGGCLAHRLDKDQKEDGWTFYYQLHLDSSLCLPLLHISSCWTRHWSPCSSHQGLSTVIPAPKVLIHVLKDLPSGMFAGAKIPSKVRARTLIEMSFSLRTIDLDFTTGTFSTSGWMTLEWDDPRWGCVCINQSLFNGTFFQFCYQDNFVSHQVSMGACWVRQHCFCTTSILQGILCQDGN